MDDSGIEQQLLWDQVREGDCVPRVSMDLPFRKIILNTAATWDYFPGHHDPEYARVQGHKTIYASTLFFTGFIDRVITDWAGPRTFVAKRKLSMQKSVYAGDVVYGEGRVKRCYEDESGRKLVDVDVAVGNEEGKCASALVTIILPVQQ